MLDRIFTREFGAVSLLVAMLGASALPVRAATSESSTPTLQENVAPAAPGLAQNDQNPFRDVRPGTWPYEAVQRLAREGLVKGYPDGTFKGNRPLTRYEMAVVINRTVQYVEQLMAQQKPGVTPEDLAALRRLIDEFRPELAQLQAAVKDLQAQNAATRRIAEENRRILARQQFHLYYFLRAPGIFNERLEAYNGPGYLPATVATPGQPAGLSTVPGGALPPGTPITWTSNEGNVGQNSSYLGTGEHGHGTGYQVLRMVFSGDASRDVSYAIRLEDRYYFDNVNGISTINPTYCTSITSCPANADYPANGALRLNYAALTYKFGLSGAYVTAGRYVDVEAANPLDLNYADYFNGVHVGYDGHGVHLDLGYGSTIAALSNTGAQLGQSANTLFGTLAYDFGKHFTLGGSYVNDSPYPGQVLWNPNAVITTATGAVRTTPAGAPITGLYESASTPIATGTVFGILQWGRFWLGAEGLHRFGNDPFTGTSWERPNAVWAELNYGPAFKGIKGDYYAKAGFIDAGANSTNGHTNITGTTNYQQFYISNINGYRVWYGGLFYWLSNDARIGGVYQHYLLQPGTTLPASSPSCPGCFVAQDQRDAFVIETLLSF